MALHLIGRPAECLGLQHLGKGTAQQFPEKKDGKGRNSQTTKTYQEFTQMSITRDTADVALTTRPRGATKAWQSGSLSSWEPVAGAPQSAPQSSLTLSTLGTGHRNSQPPPRQFETSTETRFRIFFRIFQSCWKLFGTNMFQCGEISSWRVLCDLEHTKSHAYLHRSQPAEAGEHCGVLWVFLRSSPLKGWRSLGSPLSRAKMAKG